MAPAYRFYRRALSLEHTASAARAAPGEVVVWRPSWTRVPPLVVRRPVNWVWWLFHNLHVFRSRAFCVIVVAREGRLVHRSTVFPPYFRFPFMGEHDEQIGDTWTDEAMRGHGLAGVGIRAALAGAARDDGHAWYVVEEYNHASIRAAEKEGFELVGHGSRRSRLGVRVFGYYAFTEQRPVRGADAS
jgi:RimJ/RimL family protein N-acetyltransferase